MEKFSISNRTFVLTKMDCFKQFHVVRRVGPILADMLPTLQSLMAGRKEFDRLSEDEKFAKLAPIASPFMNGLAKLSDEDADYVLHRLLECVEIEQGKIFAKVFANGMLMFQDLQLPVILQIAGRALIFNLSGFFAELPQ